MCLFCSRLGVDPSSTHAEPGVVAVRVDDWHVVGVVEDDPEGLGDAQGAQHAEVMLKGEQSVPSAPQIVHCGGCHLNRTHATSQGRVQSKATWNQDDPRIGPRQWN